MKTASRALGPTPPRETLGLQSLPPLGDGGAYLFGGGDTRFDELGGEPREQADQVECYEDLPIAVRAGADAYGRYRNSLRDLFGDRRRHQFQHDREGAGLGQRVRIGEEC